MEFLSLEAEVEGPLLQFSDDELEKITDEVDDFIGDDSTKVDQESRSFYSERNPTNVQDYPRFNGQVRDPLEAVFSENESYFGEDEQP